MLARSRYQVYTVMVFFIAFWVRMTTLWVPELQILWNPWDDHSSLLSFSIHHNDGTEFQISMHACQFSMGHDATLMHAISETSEATISFIGFVGVITTLCIQTTSKIPHRCNSHRSRYEPLLPLLSLKDKWNEGEMGMVALCMRLQCTWRINGMRGGW